MSHMHYFACTYRNRYPSSNQLQRSPVKEKKSFQVGMCEHLQSMKHFFRHKKMHRESYGGRLIPNVKEVTITKPKEKSL